MYMQTHVITSSEIVQKRIQVDNKGDSAQLMPDIINFKSVVFGDIGVEADKIITFSCGLLGFPDMKRFIVMEYEKDIPFMCLQAVDEPCIAFIVIDPVLANKDYHIAVKEKEVAALGEPDSENLIVFVIVSISKDTPSKATANLRAPLIVNLSSRTGRQIVLDDEDLSIKYPLFKSR
ncbi:MAG: flagellar assembly protein FliW [Deltaproteobacteria bacterium]|nr:flagellar assembly protein FliW [Deltaproteobacteria bacterium]